MDTTIPRRGPRSLYLGTLLVAWMAAGGLAACDRPSVDADLGRAPDAVVQAGNAVADAAITASVRAQLALDAELRASNIDVDTVAGRVALTGSAPNPSARERASQIAASIDGVRSVDNRLGVAQG